MRRLVRNNVCPLVRRNLCVDRRLGIRATALCLRDLRRLILLVGLGLAAGRARPVTI